MNETAVIHQYIKNARGHKDLFLNEAVSLVKAIDLKVVYSKAIGIDKINSNTYLRSGAINNLKQTILDLNINLYRYSRPRKI